MKENIKMELEEAGGAAYLLKGGKGMTAIMRDLGQNTNIRNIHGQRIPKNSGHIFRYRG